MTTEKRNIYVKLLRYITILASFGLPMVVKAETSATTNNVDSSLEKPTIQNHQNSNFEKELRTQNSEVRIRKWEISSQHELVDHQVNSLAQFAQVPSLPANTQQNLPAPRIITPPQPP